jgi:cell division protein FtsI (penicillin-binding protein 3)
MPVIKSPNNKSWGKTTIPFMAHGYEELVTPLHMLMLYNAVANNGKLMKPYLVNSIRNYGIEVEKFEPTVLVDKIVSDEALVQARECLKAVVDSVHGTGHRVMFDSAYSISGKTGTAVSALNNKGYNKGNKIYQASFIGYFPSENPKYSMAVVIQNSKKSKLIYGADVSGTVFKEVSDKIYNHFLSKPNRKENITIDTALYSYIGLKNDAQKIFNTIGIAYRDSVVSSSSSIWRSINYKNNYAGLSEPAQISTVSNITPNVTGMGLKDAVYLLENKGLTTVVTGKGKVYSQSLTPGSNFSKGQKILLMLN